MLHKPNSQVSWVQIITWRASSAPYCSFLSSSCPFFPLLHHHHHHPMKSNPKLSLTSQLSTECSTSRTPKLSSWTNKTSATRKGVLTRRRWGERRSRTLEPGLSLPCYQRVFSLPPVHLGATMTTPSRKLYIVPSPTQNLKESNLHRTQMKMGLSQGLCSIMHLLYIFLGVFVTVFVSFL